MATLRGFPASNTISPSVRITENDLTFISPTTSVHNIGLIGFASKGPINTPTSVTSLTDLVSKFGNPHPDTGDPYLIYAAQQVLRVSSDLIVVRVGDTDPTSPYQAKTASVEVPAAGGIVQIIGNEVAPFNPAENMYFSWKLNGTLASKVLKVRAGSYATVEDIVNELNNQPEGVDLTVKGQNALVPTIDGIQFVVIQNDPNDPTLDTVGVESVWAYGTSASIELVSHQDTVYGGASSLIGMGTLMTQAINPGSEDHYPLGDPYITAGTWDFTASSADDLANALQIVISGTGNVNYDDVVQVIDLSALAGTSVNTATLLTAITNEINTLPGEFEVYTEGVAPNETFSFRTKAYGSGSRLLVKSSSYLLDILGLESATAVGESPVRYSLDGDTFEGGVVRGSTANASDYSFEIYADSPGIEGNATTVVITTNSEDGTFSFKVFNNGQQVEAWGNLNKNQDSAFYVATYINANSNYIRVVDNTATPASPANTGAEGITLSGGTDGIPVEPDAQDDLVIGNPTAGTGLYAFSETEQINVDLLATPGRSSTAVIRALIDVCETYRQDAMAIVDPPFGLNVREIIDWQNGTHPLNNERFNTDYAALYYPWVEQTDVFNNIPVWVPPSGSVLATICQSDNFSGPWLAPAGLTRGVVPNINNVFTRPTLAERDLMYGNSNAINPIITFPDITGFCIWGQKTLQRTPTALDRVNVRRMLFYVEKAIKSASRALLFEPNTAATRERFITLAAVILSQVQTAAGLNAFVIKCDDELNPPDVVARNELRARIGIVPTYAVEYIFIEFNLTRSLA